MQLSWCYHTPVLLMLLASLRLTRGDMFSALIHMEKLLRAERDVANDIRDYVAKEQYRLNKLKSIADDYEKHSIDALADTEKHLANPVNAFLLVKRFTSDWQKVKELIETNSTADDLVEQLNMHEDSFPSVDDLNGAATALLRLQDTYKLPTTKIAAGNLSSADPTSPEMTAEECFELGRFAYVNGDYYHCMMWMQEALRQYEREKVKSINKPVILDHLAYATSMQGNIRHAYSLTNELLAIVPGHQRALSNKRHYEKILKEEKTHNKLGDDGDPPAILKNVRPTDSYRSSEEFLTYESLCRGEETVVRKGLHRLKCYYENNNRNPSLLLRPIKAEDVHMKPWLVIYHDIISDNEIKKIKEIAGPRLARATVHNPQTGKLETAFYRVSKSAWLQHQEDEVASRINDRIEALTGLNLETAEDLQVVNYGIGGHYEPHYDFARKEEIHAFKVETGNRIATLLLYMSDVEAGGSTVFINLGLNVRPKKGTAVFWWNLLKNGEGDMTTRHAACPVLTGSKWVMNKWFHERGQEFKRPCGLDVNEYK